jgi:mono/diheme cytochrome c family protein
MKAVLLLCAILASANPYEGNPDAVRAGAKLYARHCAQCPGRSAEGYGRAPSLRSPAVQTATPEALFDTVTNGRMSRGMPTWGHLPAERRWQIVTYLRSLK